MKTVLAISPHADDTELGLGGYLSRLRNEGGDLDIEIGILAIGDASFSKKGDVFSQRLAEAKKSGDLVGAKVYGLHGAPDGQFNAVPSKQLVKCIEHFVFDRATPPDELFIPLPSFHSDHTVTYEAAIAALRPRMGRALPKRVYAYEYPSNHWGPQPPATGKAYRVLDAEDIETKLKMLSCYQSQWVSEPGAPGLGADAVEHLARLRGSEVGEKWAELFFLIRCVD